MVRVKSDYRAAVEKLREKHADKIESIFVDMYNIAHGVREDGQPVSVEDRDRVNAAKVCVSLLGVARPSPEKPEPKVPGTIDKPTISKEQNALLDEILGKT